MKICPVCHEELADNVRFCSFCGHAMEESSPAAPNVSPQQMPPQAYYTPSPAPAAPKKHVSPLPFIGLGLSVLAVILCAVPVLAILLAIAGLVVSIIGCRSRNRLYGFAVAGILVAILAFLLAAVVGGISAVGRAVESANENYIQDVSTDTLEDAKTADKPEAEPAEDAEDEPEAEPAAAAADDSEAAPETEAAAAEEPAKNYEIIGEYSYVDSIGVTHFLKLVTANRDEEITLEVIVKDPDDRIVGTMEDFVYLEAGDTGVLTYTDYEIDDSLSLSDLNFELTYSAEQDLLFQPHSSAFEAADYNSSGDNLYVTVRQTEDESLIFPQIQVLFFNGDQLVDYDYSYADLDGIGSEDVLDLWVYGVNYDSVQIYTEGY